MWLSNSSIGRKVVMSITGLFLVLFLTFHMCMNLVALISPAGDNAVCQFLGANWYALAGTVILAAGAVLHIVYAFWLTLQNRKARGNDRYLVNTRPQTVEWAFSKHARFGYHRFVGIGFAPLQLLVQNAAQRNRRSFARSKSSRRNRLDP